MDIYSSDEEEFNRLIDWLIDWQIGSGIDWLIDWLIDYLIGITKTSRKRHKTFSDLDSKLERKIRKTSLHHFQTKNWYRTIKLLRGKRPSLDSARLKFQHVPRSKFQSNFLSHALHEKILPHSWMVVVARIGLPGYGIEKGGRKIATTARNSRRYPGDAKETNLQALWWQG